MKIIIFEDLPGEKTEQIHTIHLYGDRFAKYYQRNDNYKEFIFLETPGISRVKSKSYTADEIFQYIAKCDAKALAQRLNEGISLYFIMENAMCLDLTKERSKDRFNIS